MLQIFKPGKPIRPNESPDDEAIREPKSDPYTMKPTMSPYQPAPQPPQQPRGEAFSQPPKRQDLNIHVTTTIGPGEMIEGQIKGKGAILIEGEFKGVMEIEEHVVIGQSGRVDGDVRSRFVTVLGKLKGNATASDKVTITDKGCMTGDIMSPSVVVADGAMFKGRIDMDQKHSQSMKPQDSDQKLQNQPKPPTPPVQQAQPTPPGQQSPK